MEHENSELSLSNLAKSIGTSEGVVRLMIALLAGYPLALLHRILLHAAAPNSQHLYFILSGILLGYFCFGFEVIHSVVNILLVYLLLLILRGTALSVAVIFLVNIVYLCIGYYFTTSTVEYTIRWTIPHCVLTLRLTGLAFDVFDGRKKIEDRSAEQKETALPGIPSLLEVAGHTFFFGGYLVGPQFPMRRYLDFVQGKFSDKVTGGPPSSAGPAVSRLIGGISYIIIYQISAIFVPDSYLLSQSFQDLGVLTKCFMILLWGKFILYRYVGVWLLTEGSCILTGLTYNGKDENGNDLWNACANIHVRQYELASTCQEGINSFNVNTNKWMAKYVYKRLRFLGNKYMSQFLTLMYLAIWHGLYSGYFVNFSLEFIIMKFEKEFGSIAPSLAPVRTLMSVPGGSIVIWIWKKAYTQLTISYALISFCLLRYDLYLPVYTSIYFIIHVICLAWIPFYPYAKRLVRGSSSQNGASQHSNTRLKTE